MDKKDENYVYYLVSQNLKKQRKLKKLTQSEFAEKCSYSDGFIMNIESPNYHQTFSLGTVWKFAEVLDIDIKELFNDLDKQVIARDNLFFYSYIKLGDTMNIINIHPKINFDINKLLSYYLVEYFNKYYGLDNDI